MQFRVSAMRVFIVALMVGIVAAVGLVRAAHAQQQNRKKELSPLQQEELEKKKQAQEVDRQYHRAVEETAGTTAPVKVDPWSNMRAPSDDAKPKK